MSKGIILQEKKIKLNVTSIANVSYEPSETNLKTK